MNCSICADEIESMHDSHNAEPVNSGRCCSDCNYTIVIKARLNRLTVVTCGNQGFDKTKGKPDVL